MLTVRPNEITTRITAVTPHEDAAMSDVPRPDEYVLTHARNLAAPTIQVGAGTSNLSTLAERLLSGQITREEARAELDAIPGLAQRIAKAEADIDRMEAEGR